MIILNRLRATRFKQLDNIDLRFPEKGTILIEGHNEAGKSSLFEAVLFAMYGRPLISDREYKISDLKQYGAENMEVVLDFSIDGRAFSLTRRFAKNHTAKLTLPGLNGGDSETISILSEIDKRVREELRLSPEALLNTCFVEQKHLERLEDMKPDARQAAINELLNLKILTRLQSEFKVAGEDRSTLALQKERVAVAALDAEWPRLQARAEAARRCWLLSRWRSEDQRVIALQLQIEAAEKTVRELTDRREEIETRQLEIVELRQRLSTLRGALTISAQAWSAARQAFEQAQQRASQLQELQASLPIAEAQQQEYSRLASQLELLEKLDREASALQQQCEIKLAALEEYDRTQNSFDENQRALNDLEAEHTAVQQQLCHAEAASAARQSAHRREGKLNLWLAQVEKFREAVQREKEAAAQRQLAQEKAASVAGADARLETLQSVRELRDSSARIERELADTRRELAQSQKELGVAVEGEAQRARMESERLTLEARLREDEQQRAAAQQEVRRVEQRAALENWLQAHVVDDAGAPSLENFAARETQSQNALQAAQEKSESAKRARTPGVAAVGAGAAAGAAALLLGVASVGGIFAAVLAAVLIAFGAWRLSSAAREATTSQAEYSRLRSEVDSLAGERRALEMQSQLASQNAARRREYQEQASRAMEALGAAVPVSHEQAQAQLAQLPEAGFEDIRRSLDEAEAKLQETRVQFGAAQRALQNMDAAPAHDAGELRGLITQTQAKLAELEAELGHAAGEIATQVRAVENSEFRDALASADDHKLTTLLDAARIEVNVAHTSARALPELARDAQAKSDAREKIEKETLQAARELELLADGDSAFELVAVTRAQAELAEIQAARQAAPDEELARTVALSRSTLGALENRISVSTSEQKQRRTLLDAVTRAELAADVADAQQAWQQIRGEVEKLQTVREAIAARELPATAQALHALVAAHHQKLQRTREDLALLPDALQEVEARRSSVESSREQYLKIWQSVLPESGLPAEPETALRALPIRAAQLESELAGLDEERLRQEFELVESRTRETHQSLATLRHQRDEAQEKLARLRSELQAEESPSLQEFESQFDAREEFAAAPEMDTAGWELEWQTRREAIAHNRSTRGARAMANGVSDELLDLTQERQSLLEAEQQIAVKRRASEIVEMTRGSIVKRVMPLTMQNIRQLLPLLTEGRYRDAEWDEAQNKILIYDNEARAMVRKHTFSGGARDQISLALRLAFALATLPGEHNIRPGFLFLDEPLSSFDRARTQALVDLLTRGLIRRHFQQIFLVSHSESFDPALFDFRLRLEGGHVALSTLPT